MSDQPRPSRSVAFLDLDHGILKRSPAALLQNGSRAGAVLDRLADLGGPLLSPLVHRIGNRGIAGIAVKDVRNAARDAAATAELQTHVHSLMLEHKAARRRLVGITRVPIEAAQPFAVALGLDDVIATRFAQEDGKLDGNTEGPIVSGRGKLDAAREWAKANGASLKRSYYYSGSLSDAPLLAEVGRPVVVDPEPRLAALAWLKGWPTRSLHAPPGVMTIAGRELQEITRPLARPELVPYARFDISGLENIPTDGPAIVVGNHRSYFDGVAVGLVITQAGRVARFLGKKEVFDVPLVGAVARWAGGIRVDRGTGSSEPLEHAAKALRAGEVIMLMPEGTIPRGPAFFEPELKGRWGAAKLAAMSKAPVIPMGLWGTEKVWPRSSRLPNMNPLNRPLVTIRVGPPVPLSYDDPDTDTKAIMSAIVDLLPDEARVRREPTPEELALTYPHGYKGDPEKELARRPGTDT
jgi:putative phosphoserine phosphatase / 1-acylglycerol-3-phosphate O-acyltransferase